MRFLRFFSSEAYSIFRGGGRRNIFIKGIIAHLNYILPLGHNTNKRGAEYLIILIALKRLVLSSASYASHDSFFSSGAGT